MRADQTSNFDLVGPADYYDQRHQLKKKKYLYLNYSDLLYYVEYSLLFLKPNFTCNKCDNNYNRCKLLQ